MNIGLNVLKVKTCYQIIYGMTVKEWISGFKTWFQMWKIYIGDLVLERQKFFNQYLLSLSSRSKLDLLNSPNLFIISFSIKNSVY